MKNCASFIAAHYCQVPRHGLHLVIRTSFTAGVQRGAYHYSGTLPAEVDFLHQGAAEVDQYALVEAFEPDRMRGQRLDSPRTAGASGRKSVRIAQGRGPQHARFSRGGVDGETLGQRPTIRLAVP